MYKIFIKDIPIIVSTVERIGKQYTSFLLKDVKFKRLIKEVVSGKLTYVNLYHPVAEEIDDILREKIKVVEAAGGLVQNSKMEYLFIKRDGKWDLPKGHLEKGESLEEGAIREVEEETGVSGISITSFNTKTYHVFKRNDKHKLKLTYWYNMHSDYDGEFVPQLKEGITKVRWRDFQQTQRALSKTYKNIKLLFPKEYLLMHPADVKKK